MGAKLLDGDAKDDFAHSGGGEGMQDFKIVGGPGARLGVDRAERAEDESRRGDEGKARVRDDANGRDGKIVAEQRVLTGIGDDQRPPARDDMLAERM